jgi:hypothetical protein
VFFVSSVLDRVGSDVCRVFSFCDLDVRSLVRSAGWNIGSCGVRRKRRGAPHSKSGRVDGVVQMAVGWWER